MPFLEPLSAVQNRSRADWDRGLADFHKLGIAGKAAAAGAGLGGAVGGFAYGIPKTFGVAGYELYSQSFGDKRGRTLFDYLTTAPVLQMLVTGGIAEGVGAALRHFHIHLPWTIVPTTFLWGALSYLSAQWMRYLPDVVGVSAHGAAGRSMHWVKNKLQPEATPATLPQPQPKPASAPLPAWSSPRYGRAYSVATRSQLNRSRVSAPV